MTFFDGQVIDRELLVWTVATRRQLDRWEAAVSEIVSSGTKQQSPAARLVWLSETERHFVFVAARNVVRAAELGSDQMIARPLLEALKDVRDILEHWATLTSLNPTDRLFLMT